MAKAKLKIISGAQTGVDRAALDAALDKGFACGGWVPEGRKDECGAIPSRYPVQELIGGGYAKRTLQNLTDADGTLILFFGELEGGTLLTAKQCDKLGRPHRLIDAALVTPEKAAERALSFVLGKRLRTLNVAGPRTSKWPEAHAYGYAVVCELLDRLSGPKGA